MLPRRLGVVGDSDEATDGSRDGAIDGGSDDAGVINPSPIATEWLLSVESSLSLLQQTGANSILAW